MKVAKKRPNDEDAKMKYTECNKVVKKLAFERAIACDKPEKTLAEMFNELANICKFFFFLSFKYLLNMFVWVNGYEVITNLCFLLVYSIVRNFRDCQHYWKLFEIESSRNFLENV